jgi:hypothetical protein
MIFHSSIKNSIRYLNKDRLYINSKFYWHLYIKRDKSINWLVSLYFYAHAIRKLFIVCIMNYSCPLKRAQLDEKTKEAASKIFAIAQGLTYQQFSNAVKLAMQDVSNDYLLLLQPVL